MKASIRFLFTIALFFAAQQINAQQNNSGNLQPTIHTADLINNGNPAQMMPNGFIRDRCGFVTQMNRAVNAGYDKAAFEKVISEKINEIKAARQAGRLTAVNYVIPVIFHVINDGTAEGTGANIIASQVYEQIDQLNKDFGNQSGSPFAVAANTGISFCPVLKDPTGVTLAQPGIERINRISKGWTDPTTFGSSNAQVNAMISYIDATIKPASIWNPSIYVNIWMYNFSNSGLLGYATFPTAGLADLPAGETATTAGVVFLSGAIGSVASPGTAGNYGLGRTVTHELGHFFGLYHVWGDVTTCTGTDYCADTPPCSDQYFSTVPGCTIPTQCSGQPRMIQDYMDYSDDGCMNTFTQNQTDRIQAVMAAAPNRPNNPPATLCTPAVANAISFTAGATNTAETGTGAVCPKFKDYIISVKPSVAASGNAAVNISFSGTATQNVDYTIIGSTSFNYTNGDAGTNSFTIRVLDDAAPEPVETVIINFSITGSGLVAGSTNQTHTISITDDDFLNSIDNTNPTTTIFSENFGTTAASGAVPSGWLKGSFTAGSNVWTVNNLYGASTGFTIAANGRALHITNGSAAQQSGETADAVYTQNSTSDVAAVTPAISTLGYKNIKVSFDYASNGETNLDYGMLRYSTTAQSSGLIAVTDAGNAVIRFQGTTAKTSVTVTLPAATENIANLWVCFEWLNNNSTRNNPPFIVDNIVVTGDKSGVETVLNQNVTQTQNTGQTAQFMSSSNKIIASVSNPNVNLDCVTATVTDAGAGITSFSTTAGNFQRSQKVIKISPAVANSTASYSATLYFTTAELTAWGGSVSSLKLMKVKDGVSLAAPVSAANGQVFSAVVDDQRATKGYASFTGNFTGGFSQFFLVSPLTVVPVALLNFDAKAGNRVINLSWNTSSELNNRGFAIERSIDGNTYERIGWTEGNNTISTMSSYAFTDSRVQAGIVYYYRLVQTNFDGRETLSEVRKASLSAADVLITLSPNPAKDLVRIAVSGSAGTGIIRLVNESGRIIRMEKANFAAPYFLSIKGMPAGVYFVQVQLNNALKTEKLIIQ